MGKKENVAFYFLLLGKILEYQKNQQWDEMFACCLRSLPILPDLVSQTKREFGRFDINGIPAIEIGCRYWAAMGDSVSLDAVSKAVSEIPVIKRQWEAVIDEAYEDLKISRMILEYVSAHPGTLQKELGDKLGIPGKESSRIIKTLTNLGRIIRTESGKTYELRTGALKC